MDKVGVGGTGIWVHLEGGKYIYISYMEFMMTLDWQAPLRAHRLPNPPVLNGNPLWMFIYDSSVNPKRIYTTIVALILSQRLNVNTYY